MISTRQNHSWRPRSSEHLISSIFLSRGGGLEAGPNEEQFLFLEWDYYTDSHHIWETEGTVVDWFYPPLRSAQRWMTKVFLQSVSLTV